MNHFIYLNSKYPGIRRPNPCSVCLPRDHVIPEVLGGGGESHIWARQVSTAEIANLGIIFYPVGFVSLSLDRVIQVVMDDLVYYPFHFVEKSNPEHSRKNCKVLRVVRWEGYFLLSPWYLRQRAPQKKVFKMGLYSCCSYMRPNQERIMDQKVSQLSV